jgi:hypothetical protein
MAANTRRLGKAKKSGKAKGKSAKKTKTKKYLSKSETDNLHGYLNPFARTGGAFIMDGAVTESQTSHDQITNIHNCSNGDSPTVIIMHANTHTPVAVWDSLANTVQYLNTRDSAARLGLGDLTAAQANAATKANPIQHGITQVGLHQWRLVSEALRITPLNTDQENDGYFDCCRIKLPFNENYYDLKEKEGVPGEAWLVPNVRFYNALVDRDISDQSSYMAGALKDIHQHQFDLHHLTEDHPFTVVPYETDIGYFNDLTDADGTIVDANRRFPLNAGEAGARSLVNSIVDQNVDMVMIRVWGRTALADQPSVVSKLLIEVALNTEVVYAEGNALARFHQNQQYSAKAKAAGNRAKRYKQSSPLAGSKRGTDDPVSMQV